MELRMELRDYNGWTLALVMCALVGAAYGAAIYAWPLWDTLVRIIGKRYYS